MCCYSLLLKSLLLIWVVGAEPDFCEVVAMMVKLMVKLMVMLFQFPLRRRPGGVLL